MKSRKLVAFTTSIAALASAFSMTGCSMQSKSGKTVITMIQYKPESVKAFEAMEERFNATHDDIELKIESPNEAMTILKTRLIKEDYPDIIGIGGVISTTRISLTRNCSWTYPTLRELTISNQLICR